jgi:SPP1 family predicted phage head-tail adaptor
MLKEPNIGELTRRLAIKRRQDMPAMGGGVTPSYTTVATVWAKIEPVGGALFFGAKQVGEEVTDRVFMRRTAALTEHTITGEHECECAGQRYRVRRASAVNGGKVWLMIEVENLGNA